MQCETLTMWNLNPAYLLVLLANTYLDFCSFKSLEGARCIRLDFWLSLLHQSVFYDWRWWRRRRRRLLWWFLCLDKKKKKMAQTLNRCLSNVTKCGKNEYGNKMYCSHHALHLPGAACTVPHQSGVVHIFVCHLGFVTVLVVEVVTLLTLNQLVAHWHRHLPEEHNRLLMDELWCWVVFWRESTLYLQTTHARPISMAKSSALVSS